jgi:O-acetyl-ADP-ribose deacetylase (regulator of RNase III)
MKLEEQASELHASVHLPRIGAGLAGGDWEIFSALIQKCLVDKGISVTVYDWKP